MLHYRMIFLCHKAVTYSYTCLLAEQDLTSGKHLPVQSQQ